MLDLCFLEAGTAKKPNREVRTSIGVREMHGHIRTVPHRHGSKQASILFADENIYCTMK